MWTWLNIRMCRFLQNSMEKTHLLVQKKAPKNYIYLKISNFWYFLSPEALNNSSKEQISNLFWSDFLEFLIFCLILWLNPHIHLFFQLYSCTGWFTIKDFPIFLKTLFLPISGTFHFSWNVCFDKINPHPLLLTVYRGLESHCTLILTVQLPPKKNWQSSVTR